MLNTEHEQRLTHVAIAVILNKGKVLIAKRKDNVHQGGLWEFPGGKVELGETLIQALFREIKEELGIEIQTTQPLIKLSHEYPDKSVLLETLLVSKYNGRYYCSDKENKVQYGLEGQVVKWVELDDLKNFSFPLANQSIIKALIFPDTYAISIDPFTNKVDSNSIQQFLKEFRQTCCQYPFIQLRIKSIDSEILNDIAQECLTIAEQQKAKIFFNSSMDLSATLHSLSAGIHLSSQHLYDQHYLSHHRQHFPDQLMAASCHCLEDIKRANQLNLDFIVLSAVMPTHSHPEQKPIGWLKFEKLTALATMPVFALGGMHSNDINQVQYSGGQGIAGISALWCKK